jgi:hypothetical protein
MRRLVTLLVAAAVLLPLFSTSPVLADELHSEVSHTILSGSQIGETTFTFNAGSVKCKQATNEGTTETATLITFKITIHFNECTAFGFVNSKVDATPCWILVHLRIILPKIKPTWECEPIEPMAVTAFNCEVTVPAQELNGSAELVNSGSGKSRDVRLNLSITGMHYIQHSKSFPGCTSGTFTNGTLAQSVTLKGSNTAGEQVGIWNE